MSQEDRASAEERRARLLAGLLEKGLKGADLHRRLVEAGERTSPATVSNWCRGAAALSEIQVRGILSLIGLGADWRPSPDLAARAIAEQDARSTLPREERSKPRRPRKTV